MRKKGIAAALLALALTAIARPADVAAQRPRWLGGGGKPEEFLTFQPPDSAFTIEIPKKDWRTLPGVGAVVVVFSDAKAEASVALEHARLQQSLEPSEITQLFVDIEVENIKARDAGSEGFRTALRTDPDGRRVIAIDFTRKGLKGVERVRQFSLPSGSDLFRLICSAGPQQFDRYAPVFEHMAESFKIGPGMPVVVK